MNNSYSMPKSPMKQMFSSVFKREDIKLSRDIKSNIFQTNEISSKSKETTPSKSQIKMHEESFHHSRFATPDTQMSKNTYKHVNSQQFNEIGRGHSPKALDQEKLKDLKYEELLKKYDRMQEFYKSQILTLTSEVDHYKKLYHKALSNPATERKF